MITQVTDRDRLLDLQSALPADCSKDFIWQMLCEKATVEYATQFYPNWAARRKPRPFSQRAKGQKPLSNYGSDSCGETFESLVAELMESKGVDRREASRLIAKRHPKSHEAFLDRCPDGRDRS